MAHFAKLNETNEVIRVHVLNNEVITDGDGVEQEQLGIDFLTELHGTGNYVQTSYNTNRGVHSLEGTPLRKNYAGRGHTYDAIRDAFIPPQPYNSFTLNEDTCDWEAPVAFPDDEKAYRWDEATTNWVEMIG
jgi:hypothetical protein